MSVSIATRAASEALARPCLARAPGVGTGLAGVRHRASGRAVLDFFSGRDVGDALYVLTHLASGVAGTRALLFEVGVYNPLVAGLGAAVVAWVDMAGGATVSRRLLEQPVWLALAGVLCTGRRRSWFSGLTHARRSSTFSSDDAAPRPGEDRSPKQ